jgi:hypothetical protein
LAREGREPVSAVGLKSDSQWLVDSCLARLRVDARLDDDPILPTIDLLPSDLLEDDDFIEVDASELVIDCPSIVHESLRTNTPSQKEVPTLRRLRASTASVKVARWPVVLCALVATYFGTIAFIRSPLGAKPEVQQVVKASRGHLSGLIRSTRSLVTL